MWSNSKWFHSIPCVNVRIIRVTLVTIKMKLINALSITMLSNLAYNNLRDWKYSPAMLVGSYPVLSWLCDVGGKLSCAIVTPLANHATHQLNVPIVVMAWSHNDATAKASTSVSASSMMTTLAPRMFRSHHGLSSLMTMNWTRGRHSVKYAMDLL